MDEVITNRKRGLNRIPFLQQNVVFFFLILFCTGILTFRIHYSGKHTYIHLLWNLFLATIPYGFSLLIYRYFHHPKKHIYGLFVFLWLLFYPNAPYIITDFIHLKPVSVIPMWFDVLILFSFAWTGLMLGFASLRVIHITIENNLGKLYGWFFAIIVMILGSFGIYLGRYPKWNSWDFILNPQRLLADVFDKIFGPARHLSMYGMTLFFSVFFILAYLLIVYFMFSNNKSDS